MKPDSRMLLKKLADRLSFMGGEIVENDVNLLPRRAQGYDFLEKGNGLAARVRGSGFAVDAAGGGIERRVQRECPLFASSKTRSTISTFSLVTGAFMLESAASSERSCSRYSACSRVQNCSSILPSSSSS